MLRRTFHHALHAGLIGMVLSLLAPAPGMAAMAAELRPAAEINDREAPAHDVPLQTTKRRPRQPGSSVSVVIAEPDAVTPAEAPPLVEVSPPDPPPPADPLPSAEPEPEPAPSDPPVIAAAPADPELRPAGPKQAPRRPTPAPRLPKTGPGAALTALAGALLSLGGICVGAGHQRRRHR